MSIHLYGTKEYDTDKLNREEDKLRILTDVASKEMDAARTPEDVYNFCLIYVEQYEETVKTRQEYNNKYGGQ